MATNNEQVGGYYESSKLEISPYLSCLRFKGIEDTPGKHGSLLNIKGKKITSFIHKFHVYKLDIYVRFSDYNQYL